MDIKLTDKQNKLLSNLVQINSELQKQIELNSARQTELLDVILEYNSVDIKNVTELKLNEGVLTISVKE